MTCYTGCCLKSKFVHLTKKGKPVFVFQFANFGKYSLKISSEKTGNKNIQINTEKLSRGLKFEGR